MSATVRRRRSISSSVAGAGQHHAAAAAAASSRTVGGGRISESGFSSTAEISWEALTMQNLNERLASYLDKVRCLESANRKLRLQIKNKEGAPAFSHDFTGFFVAIADLQAQITRTYLENQSVIVQTDRTRRSVDHFRTKYDAELLVRRTVEADRDRLRGVCGDLVLSATDLQQQIKVLEEQLEFVQRSQQEEMLRLHQPGGVHVQVDGRHSVDLSAILQEVRRQYDAAAQNDKRQLEKWVQTKVDSIQAPACPTDVQKSQRSQLSDLKRTFQSLEIELQKELTQKTYRQQQLEEVQSDCSAEDLQQSVGVLEAELQRLKADIQQQASEYQLLLDVRMRLELEIAEYRRLLDGDREDGSKRVLDGDREGGSKRVLIGDREDGSKRVLDGAREDGSKRVLIGDREDRSKRVLDGDREDGSKRVLDGAREDGSQRVLDGAREDGSKRVLDGAREDGSKRVLDGDREDGSRRVLDGDREDGSKRLLDGAREDGSKRVLDGDREDGSKRVLDGAREDGSRRLLDLKQEDWSRSLLALKREDWSRSLLALKREDWSKRVLDGKQEDGSRRLLNLKREDWSRRLLDDDQEDGSRRLLDGKQEDGSRRLLNGKQEDGSRKLLDGKQEDGSRRVLDGDREDGSKRLLDGAREDRSAVVPEAEHKVKERKPRIERRVSVIVEEMVDGKVVSFSTDTQVLEIQ